MSQTTDIMSGIKGSPVSAAVANKWAGYFWTVYGDGRAFASLTPAEKDAFYVAHMRDYHRRTRNDAKVSPAADTAAAAERAVTESEIAELS